MLISTVTPITLQYDTAFVHYMLMLWLIPPSVLTTTTAVAPQLAANKNKWLRQGAMPPPERCLLWGHLHRGMAAIKMIWHTCTNDVRTGISTIAITSCTELYQNLLQKAIVSHCPVSKAKLPLTKTKSLFSSAFNNYHLQSRKLIPQQMCSAIAAAMSSNSNTAPHPHPGIVRLPRS